jgi:hypothetical protein
VDTQVAAFLPEKCIRYPYEHAGAVTGRFVSAYSSPMFEVYEYPDRIAYNRMKGCGIEPGYEAYAAAIMVERSIVQSPRGRYAGRVAPANWTFISHPFRHFSGLKYG